jgi:anti-sigma factor RsiW
VSDRNEQAPITEADLHAYVDGLLAQQRRDEIEDYLDARPVEALRLDAYRKQNETLRHLFNPVLDEPIPARLSERPRTRSWLLGRLAAGLAIVLASGTAGWELHGEVGGQSSAQATQQMAWRSEDGGLPRQAAIAHVVYSPDVRRPVEIGADQEDQLVTWLSKRLGTPIRPPKLGKLGYELIGGRLLPGQNGPVAQFMYQDSVGRRLTLYVSNDQQRNHDVGFRFAQEGPVNVFYWIDGKFGYALSAGVGKGELARVAGAVYEQLEKS